MSTTNRQIVQELQEAGFNAKLVSDEPEETVEWLWEGFIPLGKLSDLSGDPGNLKSTLLLDIAARVTTGREMPDGSPSAFAGPRGVLIVCDEDDVRDTIKPRFLSAGGNDSHLLELSELNNGKPIDVTNEQHLSVLRQVCEQMDPPAGLIIFDSMKGHIGQANANRETNVRAVLSPVKHLAEEHHVAVVMVRHFKKDDDEVNPIYRPGGSIGWSAKVRAQLVCGPNPEDEGSFVFAQSKVNNAKPRHNLLYRAVERDGRLGVEWTGETTMRGADLLKDRDPNLTKKDLAKDWLERRLANGPVLADAIIAEATEQFGVSKSTLDDAKKEIGAKSKKMPGLLSRWQWGFPEDFPDDDNL